MLLRELYSDGNIIYFLLSDRRYFKSFPFEKEIFLTDGYYSACKDITDTLHHCKTYDAVMSKFLEKALVSKFLEEALV